MCGQAPVACFKNRVVLRARIFTGREKTFFLCAPPALRDARGPTAERKKFLYSLTQHWKCWAIMRRPVGAVNVLSAQICVHRRWGFFFCYNVNAKGASCA